MLTVKFMKYAPPEVSSLNDTGPTHVETIVLHPAKAVFIECSDVHGRQVVGVQNPVTSEVERFTIGSNRNDVMFNAAYVMNDNGKTVETVR